jgi:two-component sensor histidine kinase
MERSIEFTLLQQAKLSEAQVQSERWHAEFQRSLDSLLQLQAKTSSDVAQLASFGGELAKSQVRVQNNLAELAESHRLLAEAQKKTEERLNAFIAALNRRFGGNGRGRKPA